MRRRQLDCRAYLYEQDGFKFDGGPAFIAAPFLMEELFEGADRNAGDYLKLVGIDPFYRIEFHNGRWFEYGRDESATEKLVAQFAPADVAAYRRMLQHAKATFEKGFVEFGRLITAEQLFQTDNAAVLAMQNLAGLL